MVSNKIYNFKYMYIIVATLDTGDFHSCIISAFSCNIHVNGGDKEFVK